MTQSIPELDIDRIHPWIGSGLVGSSLVESQNSYTCMGRVGFGLVVDMSV